MGKGVGHAVGCEVSVAVWARVLCGVTHDEGHIGSQPHAVFDECEVWVVGDRGWSTDVACSAESCRMKSAKDVCRGIDACRRVGVEQLGQSACVVVVPVRYDGAVNLTQVDVQVAGVVNKPAAQPRVAQQSACGRGYINAQPVFRKQTRVGIARLIVNEYCDVKHYSPGTILVRCHLPPTRLNSKVWE